MTTMTIPPIAVESAKEAAHRLLELCMSDAPPLDRDTVRTHALDVIEALTDEEPHPCGHPEIEKGCGGCDPGAVEFIRDDSGPWVRVEDDQPIPFVLTAPAPCEHRTIAKTAYDAGWICTDEPSCHRRFWPSPLRPQPEWSPEEIAHLRAALTEEVAP